MRASRIVSIAVAAVFSSGAAWAGCDDSHKASWANTTEAKPAVVADAPATQAVKPAKEQRDGARKAVASAKKTEVAVKTSTEPVAKESLAANASQ